MSEATINGNTVATEEAAFSIVDQITENEKFEHITDSKFMTSTELCTVISELFRGIYAQFEGCIFEFMPGTNQPTISLFFNHKDEASQLAQAISKDNTDTRTANNTLRATRSYNSRLINGDRYYLTAAGKALKEFVVDNGQFYNKDGEPIWSKLVSEVAETNYAVPQQYTKVSFLDPAKIVEAIYGRVDENGTEWVYGIRPMKSIPTYSMMGNVGTSNWMIAVERVSRNEVERLANKFGLNVNAGINIIR